MVWFLKSTLIMPVLEKTGWVFRSKTLARRLHRQWPVSASGQRLWKLHERHDGLLGIEANERKGLLFKRDFGY